MISGTMLFYIIIGMKSAVMAALLLFVVVAAAFTIATAAFIVGLIIHIIEAARD
jgi:hypothetical protein